MNLGDIALCVILADFK